MSEFKGKQCDQCGKKEIDKEEVRANWIEIAAIRNDHGEKTQIFYPKHSVTIPDADFCSEECFMKFIHGDKNVPEK
jgi:hypothetical protein